MIYKSSDQFFGKFLDNPTVTAKNKRNYRKKYRMSKDVITDLLKLAPDGLENVTIKQTDEMEDVIQQDEKIRRWVKIIEEQEKPKFYFYTTT